MRCSCRVLVDQLNIPDSAHYLSLFRFQQDMLGRDDAYLARKAAWYANKHAAMIGSSSVGV